MESARCPPPPKVPSPTMSAASKGEQKLSAGDKETPIAMETTDVGKAVITATQSVEKVPPAAKVVDVSEATLESASVKEPASQGSAPMVDEEVQQKMASGEAGNDCSPYEYFGEILMLHGFIIFYFTFFLYNRWFKVNCLIFLNCLPCQQRKRKRRKFVHLQMVCLPRFFISIWHFMFLSSLLLVNGLEGLKW